MKRTILHLLFCCCTILPAASSARAGEVHLCCAASLKEVMNELASAYARNTPAAIFVKNYGASGTLARQVESGAPADIFISANVEWMEHLKKRGLVEPSSVRAFAFNALVFAGSTRKRISGMKDLLALEKIALGSPGSVPAGAYAMEAIGKAGLQGRLESRLVFARDAGESLMYAERGEVDGAFVYRSDALLAKKARVLFTVAKELYPRVAYPMALTASGAKSGEAAGFFKYLQSRDAKTVLARHGFALR